MGTVFISLMRDACTPKRDPTVKKKKITDMINEFDENNEAFDDFELAKIADTNISNTESGWMDCFAWNTLLYSFATELAQSKSEVA